MPNDHNDQASELRLESQLCFAIYSAAHAFTAAYKPMLDAIGVTYPQYLVLLVLWETDGSSVSQIGAKLNLDSGTLTPIMKRLEARGFLSRRRDEHDERIVRAVLTRKGISTRKEAIDIRRSIVCSLGLSEPEIQKTKRLVEALEDKLRRSTLAS